MVSARRVFNAHPFIQLLLIAALMLSPLLTPRAEASAFLLGAWDFDEGSGTVTSDSSGNGFDGALVGTPTWSTDVPATLGNSGSLAFSGDDGVRVENSAAFEINDFSVSVWIKPTWESGMPGYDPTIASLREFGDRWSFHMRQDYTGIDFHNGSVHPISAPITPNVWTHVALVLNTTTSSWSLYLNGALAGSTAASFNDWPGDAFSIGGHGSGEAFVGLMDEVRFYDGVLSAAQIAALADVAEVLTVTKTNTGSGSVTSSSGSISCGSTCQAGFTSATVVTLTATPDLGSTFGGWSGACIGYIDCVVTMDQSRSVTATFLLRHTAAGALHTCRLTASGDAQCWGHNADGQAPGTVTGPFKQIEVGSLHSCGLKTDGSVQCWGSDGNGQSTPPTPNGPFVQISTTTLHTCAIKTDGTPVCWGLNAGSQATPVGGPYLQIVAGFRHSCGLKPNGDIECWGSDMTTAGPGSTAAGPFQQIAISAFYTCALRTNGDLACWKSTSASYAPSSATGPFAQLEVGDDHTCTLSSSGTIRCWGIATAAIAAPTAVTFSSISAGWDHICGVRLDTLIQCWGLNASGQAPQPTLQPTVLPEASLDGVYSQTMTLSSGGWAPNTATLTSGTLPSGMSLTSDGIVTGMPTETGAFSITIHLADTRGLFASRSYSLNVLEHARPVASAGADQTLLPGAQVQLDGGASSSPGGYTPLTYQWQQTAGTSVALSDATSATPTFTAPITPGNLTFSLAVTDTTGLPASPSDSVKIAVTAIAASTTSPVVLGEPAMFTATVVPNVSYSWDFGDGSTGSGQTAQHTYASAGTYTATVTATSGTGISVATSGVIIIEAAPGGVVDDISLWLRADAGVTQPISGVVVVQWADQSGFGRDMAQATSSHRPSYQAGIWNGNPALAFDTTDYLTRTLLATDLFSSDQATILFAKRSVSGGVWFKWEAVTFNRVGFELNGSAARFDMPRDTLNFGRLNGTTPITDRAHLVTGWRSPTAQRIYVDGGQDASVTHGRTLSSSTSTLALGKQADGGMNWNGQIGEVIVYKRALSDAERSQVESYLAIKYGLPLGSATSPVSYTDSSGATIWAGDATYQNNVAGIGRDDASALDQRRTASSASGDSLTVAHGTLNDPTAPPADRSFLIWGHDGSSLTATITGTRANGAGYTRLARSWRVQRTGDLDSVTLAFDLTALPVGSYDPSGLALLIDTDTDFSDAQLVQGALEGSTTFFSVSDLPEVAYIAVATDTPRMLSVTTSSGGSVTSDIGGLSCGITCTAEYDEGSSVTLTAAPAAGWKFTGWGGDCSGTSVTCTLTMSQSHSVTAHFCGADQIVTSSAESGVGSLRQAIADSCPGGTIGFDVDRTITLSSPLLITRALMIAGAGHTVVISGADNTQLFTVSGSGVTLSGLTLTDGAASLGGAIHNTGTLTITGSTIRDSFSAGDGGALSNGGSLTVIGSTLRGNRASMFGGAITNSNGSLTIQTSTISGNQASTGAGLFLGSSSTLLVGNSTLTGNQASGAGGGAAIYGGTATISNTTFAANRASTGSAAELDLVTATLTLNNSILADSVSGLQCNRAAATLTLNRTLIEDGSCGATLTGDPQLSALGDYGGSTQTFALLPGSPALDAGSGCPSADQRGVARPQGTGCDLGAFESRGFTLSAVSGGGQSTNIDSAFASPLVVQLGAVDSGVQVGAGHVITFTAPSTGASLSSPVLTATTGLSGTASLSATANGIEGSYVVAATAASVSTPVSFALQQLAGRMLTVTLAGDGSGSVTSSPAGLSCGTTCAASFAHSAVVTLTATPADGALFEGWGGDGASCGTSLTCQLTLDQARSVTATFVRGTTPVFLPLVRR